MDDYFTKTLIGVGALGVTGLSAWGVYYFSTPKTIQDKLSREGLRILNLDKNTNTDEAIWKNKIASHNSITATEGDQANLKIGDLDLSTISQEEENIKKFKGKCSELLLVSLDSEDASLKEQKARKWCVEDTPAQTQ